MNDRIRRIEDSDFKSVSGLFNFRKTVEELKWLYTDPNDNSLYNAFVSVDNNNIITGVIGFIASTYSYGENSFAGVIPMNWQLKKDYKGMAGVMLFKEILKQGQFAIAVEGSETAKNLYKLFKYNQISEINLYHKVLNIGEFYKTIRRKKILKRIGIIITFLPSYLRNEFKKENDIELIRYSNESTLNISTSNIFQKVITKNYLNWLLKCPVLEPFGFFIMHDKRVLGICVLYVQEIENIKIGRIVHLPYLGDNQKIWMKVINKCLLFFKEQKCCYVSGLAHNYNCRKGYISSGFLSITNDKKPLYIRDLDKRLSEIDLIKWHLQFTEGDKAYRDLLK